MAALCELELPGVEEPEVKLERPGIWDDEPWEESQEERGMVAGGLARGCTGGQASRSQGVASVRDGGRLRWAKK